MAATIALLMSTPSGGVRVRTFYAVNGRNRNSQSHPIDQPGMTEDTEQDQHGGTEPTKTHGEDCAVVPRYARCSGQEHREGKPACMSGPACLHGAPAHYYAGRKAGARPDVSVSSCLR